MSVRAVILTILFIPLMTTAALVSAAVQEPHEVVTGTVEGVIERVRAEKAVLDAQPEKIYDVINELILPRFDFNFMSKAVLGKTTWKNSSVQQHADFTAQFTNLLVRTYAKALLGYSDETIKYIETVSNPNSNIVLVKTEIVSGAGEGATPVDYWLHLSDGNWKVINVAFQGVNLVKTYRQSFASEVNNNGIDSLIQKLTDKNEKLAKTVLD